MTGHIIAMPDVHFPDPFDSREPWCGCNGPTTIVVDAVGCEDCNLLKGFRSHDPAKRAIEDMRAKTLRAQHAQRRSGLAGRQP